MPNHISGNTVALTATLLADWTAGAHVSTGGHMEAAQECPLMEHMRIESIIFHSLHFVKQKGG